MKDDVYNAHHLFKNLICINIIMNTETFINNEKSMITFSDVCVVASSFWSADYNTKERSEAF